MTDVMNSIDYCARCSSVTVSEDGAICEPCSDTMTYHYDLAVDAWRKVSEFFESSVSRQRGVAIALTDDKERQR